MKKLTISLILTLFTTILMADLPKSVRVDQYTLNGIKLNEEKKYSNAINSFKKAIDLKVELPINFYFHYGKAIVLFKENNLLSEKVSFKDGQEMLEKYITENGKAGSFYTKALEYLTLAENGIKKIKELIEAKREKREKREEEERIRKKEKPFIDAYNAIQKISYDHLEDDFNITAVSLGYCKVRIDFLAYYRVIKRNIHTYRNEKYDDELTETIKDLKVVNFLFSKIGWNEDKKLYYFTIRVKGKTGISRFTRVNLTTHSRIFIRKDKIIDRVWVHCKSKTILEDYKRKIKKLQSLCANLE